MMYFCIL